MLSPHANAQREIRVKSRCLYHARNLISLAKSVLDKSCMRFAALLHAVFNCSSPVLSLLIVPIHVFFRRWIPSTALFRIYRLKSPLNCMVWKKPVSFSTDVSSSIHSSVVQQELSGEAGGPIEEHIINQ